MTTEPRFTIVGLGEILWDIFPDRTCFGGAPANFACLAAALCPDADVYMAGGIGRDRLGRQAVREFRERDVLTSAMSVLDKPSGTVDVSVDETGHATYQFADDCAWDFVPWTRNMAELAARADAVCFGTLGQRNEVSRNTIQRFLRATRPECLRILDINFRPPFFTEEITRQSLELCNCLKLNDEELGPVARLSDVSGSLTAQLSMIADRWDLKTIVLTRGSAGAIIRHGRFSCETNAIDTDIVDTVGAGDAFTAAVVIGLLAGMETSEICLRASEVAAFVCSQAGATPRVPDELKISVQDETR